MPLCLLKRRPVISRQQGAERIISDAGVNIEPGLLRPLLKIDRELPSCFGAVASLPS